MGPRFASRLRPESHCLGADCFSMMCSKLCCRPAPSCIPLDREFARALDGVLDEWLSEHDEAAYGEL